NKEMVRKFLCRGNHFLVANRRQREYWVKTSKQLGVSVDSQRISVLPTGSGQIQNSEFRIQNSARRNIVLWFGGIYPWMDPLPLVEAFGNIAKKFPNWKLRFLGGFHPDTGYKNLYQNVVSLARSKIYPKQLEFIPWQTESNLIRYLSDVAFSVHLSKQTPEDYYAHRVRLLTLLSAGIPVLTAGQDTISDLAVRLGAASKTKLDIWSIEKCLNYLINYREQLNKMNKYCLKVE
ncbi:MAG: glycosyltransferase, partial [Gallionella sp.]|nr:glycosyltransferase [Gallionella sp.]